MGFGGGNPDLSIISDFQPDDSNMYYNSKKNSSQYTMLSRMRNPARETQKNTSYCNFGEFEHFTANQQRQLLMANSGAPGNQGRYLSETESRDLLNCLIIKPAAVHDGQTVMDEYLEMYGRSYTIPAENDKRTCPCNMYQWHAAQQRWDLHPLRDKIKEFEMEANQYQERLDQKFMQTTATHLAELKERKTKKNIQKLKYEFAQIQREC